MKIGLAIRRARTNLGWTQLLLAKRLSVPRVLVNKHENGRAVPTLPMVERYSVALDIPAWRLVRWAENNTD